MIQHNAIGSAVVSTYNVHVHAYIQLTYNSQWRGSLSLSASSMANLTMSLHSENPMLWSGACEGTAEESGGRRGRIVLLKHWQSGQRNSPAAHCTDWPGRGKKWRLLCSCRLLSMNLRKGGRER